MKPIISVIVPVYNVQDYVSRCIKSILEQSFKNFEVILVNDGSTDNSLKICQEYENKDKRVKLLSQPNQGLSAARNTGLEIADGYFICFVDSDDFIEKDYLKLLLENIKSTDSDISMCEYFLTDEKGEKISIEKFNEPEGIAILSGKETFKYFYKGNYAPNVVAWNKLYKASIFKTLRYKEGYYFEDEFIARPLFYTAKKVSILRIPLYNYVQRAGSIMNSSWNLKQYEDRQLLYKERIRYFKNRDKAMYKFAVHQYKDWIVGIEYIDLLKVKKLKFQDDFRKYFGIRSSNNLKLVLKDFIGYTDIRILVKVKSIIQSIRYKGRKHEK